MSKDNGTRCFLPIKSMTPDEYLRQHKINGLLKKLGVTDEQKKLASLVPNAAVAFSFWPVTSKGQWPSNTTTARRAWCALKWLILDNPEDSKETDEAWKCVQEFLNSRALEAGAKHLLNAKDAGAKSRAASLAKAKKFADDVDGLMENNSRLTETAAVQKAAKNHNKAESTGWNYLKKAKSDKQENSTPNTADLE